MKRQAGFTLIELLIVLAIIAIIAGILAYNVFQGVQDRRLNEAAMQVMTDLRTARLKAQTTATDSSVSLCVPACTAATTTAQSGSSYTVTYGGQPTRTQTLPYQIRVANVQAPTAYVNTINYSAPYSEITATGAIWSVTDRRGRQRFIKIIGVTGKVSLSASL